MNEATEEVPNKKGTTNRRALTGEEVKARTHDELMALDNVKAKYDEALD